MQLLLAKLKNPPAEFRPVPLWSWNDKLDPDVLKWQIREMFKAGLGGFFMHARGGLKTGYLKEDWLDCIQTSIEEGLKCSLGAWIYDENGWPSGFSDGLVPAMGEKYHLHWLELEEIHSGCELKDTQTILGIYRCDAENQMTRIELTSKLQNASEDDSWWVIRQKSNPYYVDNLNPEVVATFIKTTHEKYYQIFKDSFGKEMPGFFTDEPQISRSSIPWSPGLTEIFRQKYGYDLIENLVALFINGEGCTKIRYDFWGLVNELFVNSCGRQIYEWCDEHHSLITGHLVGEESLFAQMRGSAGVMPYYEYFHIPGMDWLGRKIGSPIIPKQVSSVVNQLGKKFSLSEMFALCGWDLSLEEMKWIAEWQYVNGINLICPHLQGYTLKGLRKRDYPPSLFYQQSWWEEYSNFNNYFSRLGFLLTSGKPVVDVLIIHPLKSAWVAYDNSNNEVLRGLDRDFLWISETLSDLHIDYHYGDETLIRKYGRVEGGKFYVGQRDYQFIIMPTLLTIDQTTLNLLLEFLNQGGHVVSVGGFPSLVNGLRDEAVGALQEKAENIGTNRDLLCDYLRKVQATSVSIAGENGEIGSIHCCQVDCGDSQLFYMVNHDRARSFEAEITIHEKGRIMECLLEDDRIKPLNYRHEGNTTRCRLSFLPMQSHVIVLEKGSSSIGLTEVTKTGDEDVVKPGCDWDVESMDWNSLMLDICHYSIDNGEWVGPIPVIRLLDILLALKKRCKVALKFHFETDLNMTQDKSLFLILEEPEASEIFLNGHRLLYQDTGWWKDHSFKKVDIRAYVKEGINEVILKRDFYQSFKVYETLFAENVLESEKNKLTFDVELESIYVVGDFGVISRSDWSLGERKAVLTDGPFAIVNRPQQVRTGSLTQQGFCFFAGAVRLSQTIRLTPKANQRIFVDLGKANAAMAKVYCNDILVKTILWAPFHADITDYALDGVNKLTVELFTSNRNLLGPHHHVRGEVYAVCPSSFTNDKGWGSEDEENQWRDRYCLVEFGLESKGME